MPVHELAQLTWEEVRDLDREQTLVVLPVGAIEAHGPHLPLDTDVVIATAMARAGARKLTDRGHVVLILPALAYIFFFSSRRRHTRCLSDWSSDVCSSD